MSVKPVSPLRVRRARLNGRLLRHLLREHNFASAAEDAAAILARTQPIELLTPWRGLVPIEALLVHLALLPYQAAQAARTGWQMSAHNGALVGQRAS